MGSGGDGIGVSWGRGWGRWAAAFCEPSGAGEARRRPGGCKGAKSRGFSARCPGLCHGVRAAAASCPRVMPPVWPRQGAPSRVSASRRPVSAGRARSPPRIAGTPGSGRDRWPMGLEAGWGRVGVRGRERAAKSRRPRIHELPLCLSGARLLGAGREFSRLLSCIYKSGS